MQCEKRNWVIVLPNPSDELRDAIKKIATANGRQVGSEVQKILESFTRDNIGRL